MDSYSTPPQTLEHDMHKDMYDNFHMGKKHHHHHMHLSKTNALIYGLILLVIGIFIIWISYKYIPEETAMGKTTRTTFIIIGGAAIIISTFVLSIVF